MKELMIHVERIVRPVRAIQSRKLRMRRELLTHLQSAVDEERAQGFDEPAAIKRAVERLGDPIELTRQLQHTVPWIQRLLLTRIPVLSVERWEKPVAQHLYGGPITLLHVSILSGVAGLLGGVPSSYTALVIIKNLMNSGYWPAYPAWFFLVITALSLGIALMSLRYVLAAAAPRNRPDLPGTLRRAGTIVVLQMAFVVLTVRTGFDRPASVAEIIGNFAVTSIFLIGSLFVARKVASLRRPYDEWLTLDVAR